MKLTMLAAVVLVATTLSAFAQTQPQPQKQKTQEGGGTSTPCNLVADPSADPDCKNYKQRTQNLTPGTTEDAAMKHK